MWIDHLTVEAAGGTLHGVNPGERIHITRVANDSRKVENQDCFVGIKTEIRNGSEFYERAIEQGASLLVLDHLPLPHPTVPLIVVTDTLVFLRKLAEISRERIKGQVIAITGSAGKTSTKEFLATLLTSIGKVAMNRGNLNNHLGVLMTLVETPETIDFLVIELGTSAPGEIPQLAKIARPHSAIITLIGHSHMAELKTLDAVYTEKTSLLRTLPKGGFAVINGDDPYLSRFQSTHLTLCRYGYTQDQLQVKASSYRVKNGKSSFVMENCQSGETGVVDLTTPGKHMMLNTLAAFAMGFHYGISLKNMIKIVGEFKTVAGRMKILPCNSYLLIDDSYNANPDSVCAALQTMHSLDNNGKKVAILGDMLELGELSSALHEEIGRQLVKNKIDFFIAVGEAMQFALRSAKKAGMKEQQLKSAANSEDAVLQLKPFMEFNKGDLVLVKGSRGMKMERIVQTLLCSTTS